MLSRDLCVIERVGSRKTHREVASTTALGRRPRSKLQASLLTVENEFNYIQVSALLGELSNRQST